MRLKVDILQCHGDRARRVGGIQQSDPSGSGGRRQNVVVRLRSRVIKLQFDAGQQLGRAGLDLWRRHASRRGNQETERSQWPVLPEHELLLILRKTRDMTAGCGMLDLLAVSACVLPSVT